MPHAGNRIGGKGRSIIHAAGVRPFRRGYAGDIIRAEGALCGWRISSGGLGLGLSRRGGALEFVAEVLKVFLADLQLEYFFDHRREVCQRADCSQSQLTKRLFGSMLRRIAGLSLPAG